MRDTSRQRRLSKDSSVAQARSCSGLERFLPGIICFCLVAIVWIIFGQTLRQGFLNYDDNLYVYDNPRITSGLSLDGIGWAFTHVHADNWHPLTTISHMLDCQLYGLEPWGHHLTNVLLHSAVAVLLFVALWELTESLWPSAFVTAVFAIHPLRVSSVAWIAERKDVLSGVFFMLTLWAYARYARGNRASSTLALVFFALGLMCKPTLVTLPFILLLLDYWPLRRFAVRAKDSKSQRSTRNPATIRQGDHSPRSRHLPIRSPVIEKIPFFFLSAASCFATLLAQDRSIMTMHQLSFAGRVANAAVAYVIYVGQMAWPVGLAVFYPFPETTLTIAQAVLSSLVLLVISVIFFLWRAKYPFLLVGWMWFLGVLIPMIGIVQVGGQGHADRYTYLAQIGLYLLLTWSALELLGRWRGGRVVLVAVAVLLISGLMVNSYSQTTYWRDNETLWRQTLANTDRNYIADNGLADTLMQKGKFDEAIVHFQKSLEIYPDSAEIRNNLGNAFLRKKDWAQAKAAYEMALRFQPNLPSALNNLGISLAEMGKQDEALAQFNEALRVDPGFLDTHRNLAILLLRIGRRDEAIVHLKEALRLKPDDEQTIAQLRQLGVE